MLFWCIYVFECVMMWYLVFWYYKWYMGKKSKSRYKLVLVLKYGDGRLCWVWNFLDCGKECFGGCWMDLFFFEYKIELF